MLLTAAILDNNKLLVCLICDLEYAVSISIINTLYKIHTGSGRNKANLKACYALSRIVPLKCEEITIACKWAGR